MFILTKTEHKDTGQVLNKTDGSCISPTPNRSYFYPVFPTNRRETPDKKYKTLNKRRISLSRKNPRTAGKLRVKYRPFTTVPWQFI